MTDVAAVDARTHLFVAFIHTSSHDSLFFLCVSVDRGDSGNTVCVFSVRVLWQAGRLRRPAGRRL